MAQSPHWELCFHAGISVNSLFIFSYPGKFFYSPHHCTAFSTLFCRTPSASIEKHLFLVSHSLPVFVIALCRPPFLASLSRVFRCWTALALDLGILTSFFPFSVDFSFLLWFYIPVTDRWPSKLELLLHPLCVPNSYSPWRT